MVLSLSWVLDLKVPQQASLGTLLPVAPIFVSYVLSFFYVAIYWNNHPISFIWFNMSMLVCCGPT